MQENNDESSKDTEAEAEAEEDVGFGDVDMYDVCELMEMGREDGEELDVEDEMISSDKVIRSLKHGCVSENSLKSYNLAMITCLTYIYIHDQHLLHKSWIQSIKAFTYILADEKKE